MNWMSVCLGTFYHLSHLRLQKQILERNPFSSDAAASRDSRSTRHVGTFAGQETWSSEKGLPRGSKLPLCQISLPMAGAPSIGWIVQLKLELWQEGGLLCVAWAVIWLEPMEFSTPATKWRSLGLSLRSWFPLRAAKLPTGTHGFQPGTKLTNNVSINSAMNLASLSGIWSCSTISLATESAESLFRRNGNWILTGSPENKPSVNCPNVPFQVT